MIALAIQATALLLFLAIAFQFGLLVKGCIVLRRQARSSASGTSGLLLKSPLVPMVSVVAIVAERPEEFPEFVRRLLNLHFPKHEVLLVLTTEAQIEQYSREFHLACFAAGKWRSPEHPNLLAVKPESPGVAGAYNAAISAASGELIGLFDPAAEFAPDILLGMIPMMLQDPERITGVAAVSPQLASSTITQQLGAIASLRSWLGRCAAFAGWNMLVPVPGCCLLVRRDAIQNAGGFPRVQGLPGSASLFELILHLHGRARAKGIPFRLALAADAAAQLRPPDSFAQLRSMETRDQAALRSALRHSSGISRGLFAIGWGLPGLIWDRLLRPLLETVLYVATLVAILMGVVPAQLGVLVLLCTVGTGILVSMSAVVLRELAELKGSDPEKLVRLFFAAIPENVGYRQLRNLWLVRGFLKSETR